MTHIFHIITQSIGTVMLLLCICCYVFAKQIANFLNWAFNLPQPVDEWSGVPDNPRLRGFIASPVPLMIMVAVLLDVLYHFYKNGLG